MLLDSFRSPPDITVNMTSEFHLEIARTRVHNRPVFLQIPKNSNEYRYLKCTAISISISMWKNTEAVSVSHQDIEVFFSINIDTFF